MRHLPFIRSKAWRRWDKLNPSRKLNNHLDLNPPQPERAVEYADFVAAGLEALWKAVLGWKRCHGNKLNAFFRPYLFGALSDIAQDWRNKPGLKATIRFPQSVPRD